MDRLTQIVEKEFESKKMRIFAKVGEEIESLKRSVLTKVESYMKDENQTSIETNMKLEFRNGIARTILTGEEIKGEGDVTIEVALVDDLAGVVVDDEPEASANVEIVLLKANKLDSSDWTAEEFNATIVPQVEGKLPILAGNVALQLQGGVGLVENIKIRHHASKIKPPEFMLGARVVGSSVGDFRIKEAKTEPFILKDYRTKYKEKRENPSLNDDVSRLVSIGRGGEIHKRLLENNICTVEDFLIQLLINPQGLETIAKPQAAKWKATVENARACLSSGRMYCYIDPKHKTGVVFDILGHILGLCSGSYYCRTSTLSEKQKADADILLKSAYRNWGEVKAFDDQNSLQQHLAGLSTHMDPSLKPDFPGGAAAEMVGESSSGCSNLFGEADEQDFGSLSSVCDDIDALYDADMQCIHAWPCSPTPSFFEGLMSESNADEPNRRIPPKRWKKLLCVSKCFLVWRRVALDISRNRKKQKVG